MFNKRFYVYVLLTYLTGTTIATFVPIMSLYLTDVVKASEYQVGFYYIIFSTLGIAVTQFLAKLSDTRISRRFLVKFASFSGVCAALIYMNFPYYYLIITVGVLFLSTSSIANAQIFASGREYSIYKYGQSVLFTSFMRASFALAWVVAPPIGYWIYNEYGYETLFKFTVLSFALYGLVSHFFLPNTSLSFLQNEDKSQSKEDKISDKLLEGQESSLTQPQSIETSSKMDEPKDKILGNKDVMLLFVAFALMWTCNFLYLVSMPIYIKNELQVSETLPGFMMATCAGLEVPIMIVGGYFARKIGIKILIQISVCSAFLFYLTFINIPADSEYVKTMFICSQLLNATYIGLFAGLGMVYFQELLPSIPGQATSLFNNSGNVGFILSGIVIMFIVPIGKMLGNVSYGNTFLFSIVFMVLAFLILLSIKKVQIRGEKK